MPDQIYTTEADSGVSQDFDGLWHTVGPRFRLSEAGMLVGGRAFYPSSAPSTSFTWAVFRMSDQAIVAQVDLLALFGSPALSAWNSFTSADFDTPGDVLLDAFPDDEYIVATATDRDLTYKNTGVSYPISSGGIVSGIEARMVDGGTGLQYPAGTVAGFYFFADVEVVAASGDQFTVTSTDSAGLTDAAGVARLVGLTDSAGLTDSHAIVRTAVLTDSAGLTDTTAGNAAITMTDSAGLTDSATVEPTTFETATDSVGLTDGIMTLIGSGTIFLPGGLVPVRALSVDEILTGNRFTSFRYDLYTEAEVPLGTLTGVSKGSVDFSTGATIKSGGALDVVDIGQSVDWLSDRVRPVAIIEGVPEIPLGMFLFSEAPQEWADTGRTWSVKLLDKLTVLDQDQVDGTYSLDAGTVITTAVVTVIESAGETNHAITPSAATLSAPLAWEAGTAKLRIVNDLLAVAGYFSLWCDGNGQYRGEPYVRPAARPIRYEFLDGDTSIYSPEFVIDVDLFAIPNKFVAVGQGSGDTEALTAVATNTDPDSPYSFAARGRWIVASATGIEAASQTVLDDYARRRLIELTSPTSSVDVRHALVPDLTLNNAVRLRRVPAGVDARHVVTKMAIALDPRALVKTTLTEVVDL